MSDSKTGSAATRLGLMGRDPRVGRRWFTRLRPVPQPTLRVIAFPHIGAGASVYNGWLERLPPDIELCAVQFPGRENRLDEAFVDDMQSTLDAVECALVSQLLDQPFVFFGHCSGSIVAFEVARRLRASERAQPSMLIVSSIEAPAVRNVSNPLHLLPSDELLSIVAEFGGMSRHVLDDPELVALFEPVVRADYRLIERIEYVSQPALDVPIAVIGGRADRYVDFDSMAEWRHETTGRFCMHMLPTGHFVLDDAVDVVAGLLRDLLKART